MKKNLIKRITAGGIVCCLMLTNGICSFAAENNAKLPDQGIEAGSEVLGNSVESEKEEAAETVASYEIAGSLFVGDSYISRLERYGYASAMGFEVEAIGGDTSSMATQRMLEYGLHNPTCIVMLVGINDCGLLDFDGSHIDTMIEYIQRMEEMYPGVPILVQKVFPIAKPAIESTFPGCIPERVERFNQLVSDYCVIDDMVNQIDTRNGFIGEDGYMITEMATEDGVHLTEESYKKWIMNIQDAMRNVTKEEKAIHDFGNNVLPMPKEAVEKGAVGDSVKWIEWQLGKAGYPINETGGIKGVYGDELEQMLMEYQEVCGLPVTGAADLYTIMNLSVEKLKLEPETISENSAVEAESVSGNQANPEEGSVSGNSAKDQKKENEIVSGNSAVENIKEPEAESQEALNHKPSKSSAVSKTATESGGAVSAAAKKENTALSENAADVSDHTVKPQTKETGSMSNLQADSKLPVELKKDTVTKWLNIKMGY